jgi:drug/metabolite transporter (DMT)-like permease
MNRSPAIPEGGQAHNSSARGVLAIAACAFLWSLAGLFIKLIDWNPFAIAAGRSLIAMVFLLLVVRKPRFTFSGPQVGAALANAATMLLFIYANKATTSANAILLQYGSPVYVAIAGAVILKERPRAEHWAALVAIILGMVLLFGDGLGGGSLGGNLAAVAAGITFAFYLVFMRMQKEGSPVESVILAHGLTAAIAVVVALFLPAPVLTLPSIAAILGLGILQIGLASVLLAYGIKRVSAIESVLIAVIEPLCNPLWVFLVIGEAPSAKALVGGGVILVAVVLSSVISARRDARAEAALAAAAGAKGLAAAQRAAQG